MVVDNISKEEVDSDISITDDYGNPTTQSDQLQSNTVDSGASSYVDDAPTSPQCT